jgi:hypothetical protein
MGWDVSLYLRFDPRGGAEVWSRYLALVAQLRLRSETFRVGKIAGFVNSVDWRFEVFDEQIDANTLQDVAKRLPSLDKDRLILRTDIGVFRESRLDGAVEPLMTNLFLRGPRASWNPTRSREHLNLVWSMDDSKNYDPKMNKRSWQANWNRLLSDVETVVGLDDIAELWGAPEDFENERPFLLYRNKEAELLARVDSTSDHLGYRRIGGGALVYSREGIYGGLGEEAFNE